MADMRNARVATGNAGNPTTLFTLSQDAAARFERFTQANIGKRSAIVLDREILSAPVIEDTIRDSDRIRGARNPEEAEDLALNLCSGALCRYAGDWTGDEFVYIRIRFACGVPLGSVTAQESGSEYRAAKAC